LVLFFSPLNKHTVLIIVIKHHTYVVTYFNNGILRHHLLLVHSVSITKAHKLHGLASFSVDVDIN